MSKTILELEKSSDPIDKLKASLLTLNDLENWISSFARDASTVLSGDAQGKLVRAKIKSSFKYDLLTESSMSIIVQSTGLQNHKAFIEASKVLGEPVIERDAMSTVCRVWKLHIQDWPMLAVELTAMLLKEQKKSSFHHVPGFLRDTLKNYFPDVNYLELLEWYKNDLLTVDSNDGLPFLRDVMYKIATQTPVQHLPIPDDLSL